MRRKIVISALIAAILLTSNCIPWGWAVPIPPPAITGDNSGGAIVTYAVYETLTEQDYYVQRISPAGDFLWGERGVLIGSTGNGCPWSEAVSDGSGGAIVTWWECLPGVPGEPPSCQTYVARIDAEGDVQWQWGREGVEIESMIADGAGGVIIGVVAGDAKPSLLKIDSEGNLPWGEDGVSVGLWPERSDEMASDNSGGVIVVDCTFQGSDTVYAQRVDSQGNILWQPGGVQAYTGPAEEAQVVSDGAGGAIIAYMRDIPCEDGVGFCDSDIYVQKVDAEGDILWGPDGVPICTEPCLVQHPQIVDDGAGGAIVFWADELGVCARRIDADGHKLWDEDVPLCDSVILRVTSDGSGGAFCLSYDRVAQRLDATGTKLWGPDGITFTTRDIHESALALVPDGSGGLLISWEADVKWRHYEVSDVSYYVQRVDANGNLPWGDEGILLDP